MIELTVPDMTCGGCVRGVTAAIRALDPSAEVEADVTSHKVRVRTSAAPAAVKSAVAEAGFTPA